MKATKVCTVCQKEFLVPRCHAHRVNRCSRACSGKVRRKKGIEFNGKWYGLIASTGYYALSDGKGLLHRHIWAATFGPIPQGYVVHHKNGIKADNRIENLEMLPKSEHDAMHHHDRVEAKRGMVKR